MKLASLLKEIPSCSVYGNCEISLTGISSFSQLIQPGNLFIAKKGSTYDGKEYIQEAILRGAVAVVSDSYHPAFPQITQMIHHDVPSVASACASTFYRNPSQELFMVGITGTNGKTTTSFILKNLLEHLVGLTGLIGTIEYCIGEKRIPATRTTPDVVSNHRMLREMCDAKSKASIMEVTSHALEQRRVDGIHFDVAVFTNLSTDHLDYHGSMEKYAEEKKKIFDSLGLERNKNEFLPFAVVNRDDKCSSYMVQNCIVPVLSYGFHASADLRVIQSAWKDQGTAITVEYQGKTSALFSPLFGEYNVSNYLAAVGVLLSQNIPIENIAKASQYIQPVRGRLQQVPNSLGLRIFIDFAHSDDALAKTLLTLQKIKKEQGRLIVVFGCGGDRDRSKRQKMGEAGEKYADLCIITSDNPRSEDPSTICKEIVRGFSYSSKYCIELDRHKAIEQAIEMSSPNDVILIAGKGHESVQVFVDRTIPFDDCQVATQICAQRE